MKNNFLKSKAIKAVSCGLVFGLAAGLTFTGVSYGGEKLTGGSAGTTAGTSQVKLQTTKSTGNSGNTDSDVSKVADEVLPSIVAIDVTAEQSSTDFFGQSTTQEVKGSGSGIIVGKDDDYIYIATNNHVVDGAKSVSVTFNDGTVYDAQVKGTESDQDLAVVQVKASSLKNDTLSNIKVATLGDSNNIKVGEQAIAVGNALGYGTSVTVGIVSAKDREVTSEDVTMKLIQTDAAINPGNSGGALVDSTGAVIGINSAKYASEEVEGMGFAIPISKAIPTIKKIINSSGSKSGNKDAYLGITGTDISSQYQQYYGIPEGAYVTDVTEGSPADDAGIVKGDVIVSFNGKDVSTMEELKSALDSASAGDKVKVKVKRLDNGDYKTRTLTVTLGKKTETDESSSSGSSESGNSYGSQNGGSSFGFGSGSQNGGSSGSDGSDSSNGGNEQMPGDTENG